MTTPFEPAFEPPSGAFESPPGAFAPPPGAFETPFEPPVEPTVDDAPIDPNPAYSSSPWAGYRFAPGGTGRRSGPGGPSRPGPGRPGPSGWYADGYPGRYGDRYDERPGRVQAASVLGYVDAGLLILAGLLLVVGASVVDSWNNAFGMHNNGITAELAVDGLINMIAAGLQIAGAIIIAGRAERAERGRLLLTAGGGLCILAGVYWMLRLHDVGVLFWAVVFMALPIIALALAWSAPVTTWLRPRTPP